MVVSPVVEHRLSCVQASVVAAHRLGSCVSRCKGLVAPSRGETSQNRHRIHVPCIDRQILLHCATKEAPG